MDPVVNIDGMSLDRAFSYLSEQSAPRIAKRCAGRMGTVYARNIRQQIPPSIARSVNMAADKGIGSRTSKARVSTIQTAKAGVGVGSAMKNAKISGAKARGGRRGVGISARNLHWFGLGTDDRYTGLKWIARGRTRRHHQILTGNRIRYVGRIDKAKWGGFVQRGVAAGTEQALSVAAEVVRQELAKEAALAGGLG